MCFVLSGTGKDGSKGLNAVKRAGRFVIAQDPGDAEAESMPRRSILTGDVDAVLPTEEIPAELMKW